MSSSASSAPASVSSTAAVLSSLQLQTHEDVDAQLQSAHRLLAERRYRQAEEQVKQFMAETQKAIKEAASAKPAADGALDAAAAAASTLPTLSQLMTAFLPFLRLVSQLRRENESADFDVQVMADEIAKFQKQQHAAQQSSQQPTTTKAARVAHADYVHPQLKLAAIPGRNRGVIAVAPGLPDGCAAPASSSTDDSASVVAAPTACIPANTTLMCCKAIGFVSAPTVAASSDSAPANEDAHEEKMANALVTLLALKMGGEASLIPEVYLLDAGERYEEDRERRLQRQSSPLDLYRPIPALASPQSAHDGEADSSDLEIDLARLALIVARNAFAPPQPADSDSSEEEARPLMQSTGLWLPCSYLNHSCRPNAHWFCIGDTMMVRTLRPLSAGEEVTISYTGFDAKLYSARRERCLGWGFECKCEAWCEPFLAHPSLSQLETAFVTEVQALEPKVHQLVDVIHQTEDETVAHRNALSELRTCRTQLEKLVDQFKAKLKDVCGPACAGKGVPDDTEEDESSIALPAVTAPAAKSKTAKKKAASAEAASAPAPLVSSHPSHTRCLLVHLALPLSLLALCSVSLHDASSATAKTYRASLVKHESLSLASIDLLGRQYGHGDETVIFAWLELLNTWLQFVSAGIEHRSIEEMKAILELCSARHTQHFGAKSPAHFKATWKFLMETMGLAELLD